MLAVNEYHGIMANVRWIISPTIHSIMSAILFCLFGSTHTLASQLDRSTPLVSTPWRQPFKKYAVYYSFQSRSIVALCMFTSALRSSVNRLPPLIHFFHCFGQVIIFNKWKSKSLRWNRRSLVRIIAYCPTSVTTIMTCRFQNKKMVHYIG